MNPNQQFQAQQPSAQNTIGPKRWVLAGILILLAIILAVLIWPRQAPILNNLVATNLRYTENYGYIEGSNLYGFNGAAFYKKSLGEGGNLEILHSGSKLPKPNSIYWAGSKGALLNFEYSFIASKVEQKLKSMGEERDELSEAYTWYLDFATGNLHLVSRYPILINGASFSTADGGFYYVPDYASAFSNAEELQELLPEGTVTVNFFDIGTKKNSVALDVLDVIDVSKVQQCPGFEVCLVARDSTDIQTERLYGVQNKNSTQLLNSEGRVFGTNKPNYFVTVALDEEAQTHGSHDHESNMIEEDVNYSDQPAVLRDILDNSTLDLGFDIGDQGPITHINDSGEYYAIVPSQIAGQISEQGAAEYIAGRLDPGVGQDAIEMLPLEFSNGDTFEGSLLSIASHGAAGQSLLTTLEDEQLLFTSNQELGSSIFDLDNQAARDIVGKCINSTKGQESDFLEEERLFKIFFSFNDQFGKNINEFGKCLASSDFSKVAAYNFHFDGLSPLNGRIVTD